MCTIPLATGGFFVLRYKHLVGGNTKMKPCIQLVVLSTALRLAGAPVDGLPSPGAIPLAIDHVNVAVRDLEAARSPFERMGFTIKNGRLHENSINNLHIKFDDGTELELITASKPVDDIAKEYLNLLEQGDGGAFCCLQTRTIDPLVRGLKAVGISEYAVGSSGRYRNLSVSKDHPLRAFWYIEMPQVWRDQPKFTQHANGARGMVGVVVSSEVRGQTVALFEAFGLHSKQKAHTEETVLPLSNGDIRFLDAPRNQNGRPILGVIFKVVDLDTLAGFLIERNVPFRRIGQDAARTVEVPLEFTQCLAVSFQQTTFGCSGSSNPSRKALRTSKSTIREK